MRLESLERCELAIGSYPKFLYDARGGGGVASVGKEGDTHNWYLIFDSENFSIPALNWKTTKIIGLPLPPGIQIDMNLEKLEGTI